MFRLSGVGFSFGGGKLIAAKRIRLSMNGWRFLASNIGDVHFPLIPAFSPREKVKLCHARMRLLAFGLNPAVRVHSEKKV